MQLVLNKPCCGWKLTFFFFNSRSFRVWRHPTVQQWDPTHERVYIRPKFRILQSLPPPSGFKTDKLPGSVLLTPHASTKYGTDADTSTFLSCFVSCSPEIDQGYVPRDFRHGELLRQDWGGVLLPGGGGGFPHRGAGGALPHPAAHQPLRLLHLPRKLVTRFKWEFPLPPVFSRNDWKGVPVVRGWSAPLSASYVSALSTAVFVRFFSSLMFVFTHCFLFPREAELGACASECIRRSGLVSICKYNRLRDGNR